MALTIPDKNRPEWKQMISGKEKFQYTNYVLQAQITQMQNLIKEGKLTQNAAIDRLYELCSKYALAVQNDLKQIFKSW